MSIGALFNNLTALEPGVASSTLRAIGIRGGLRMVLASRKAGNPLPFIFSKNTKVYLSKGAELELGSPFMFGMKLDKITDHWQGGSTLNIRKDATFKISDEGPLARIGPNSTLNVSGTFSMGSTSYIHSDAHITCENHVSIGEGCAIARGFSVRDADVHDLRVEGKVTNTPEPVEIEDYVWIGTRCSVKKGVTVGEGSVIASDSVVTRNVPPNTLVAGVPAEPVKEDISWDP